MKRPREIVAIGQGLCRLTVRSEKQRDLYAKIPGVRIDDRDAEHLGYRVIFPERMRGLIQSTLDKERERAGKAPRPVQMKLTLPKKQRGGDKPKKRGKGKGERGRHALSEVEGEKGKNQSEGGFMKILIVDDDKFVLDAVGSMLTQAGHPVLKVPNAQRALEALRQRVPDLVITDIRMPVISGIELCRTIKNLHPDLPVIGMSGHAMDDMGEDLFSGFLQKPFRMVDLIDKVEEVRRSRAWAAEIKS